MKNLNGSLNIIAADFEICASCSSSYIPNVLQGTLWFGSLPFHRDSIKIAFGTLKNIAENQKRCVFCRLCYKTCETILPLNEFETLLGSTAKILVQQIPGRWERSLGLETGDVHSNSAFLCLDRNRPQGPEFERINERLGDIY